MHPVVLDEPYEFVPPYRGRCWPWLLQKYVGRLLRRSHGVEHGAAEDPLMAELGRQLHDMLEIPRPQIAPIKTISEAPSVNRGAQAEDSPVEMGSLGE
jgi:hypothetical protein